MEWVLILFLKWGYAGGVVEIPMPNYATCKQARQDVRTMDSYQDSMCLSVAKVGEK